MHLEFKVAIIPKKEEREVGNGEGREEGRKKEAALLISVSFFASRAKTDSAVDHLRPPSAPSSLEGGGAELASRGREPRQAGRQAVSHLFRSGLHR